jgi:hypothetical protein
VAIITLWAERPTLIDIIIKTSKTRQLGTEQEGEKEREMSSHFKYFISRQFTTSQQYQKLEEKGASDHFFT